jgi:hypothetical protein
MCLHEKIRVQEPGKSAKGRIYCWKNVKAKEAAAIRLSDCHARQTFILPGQISGRSARPWHGGRFGVKGRNPNLLRQTNKLVIDWPLRRRAHGPTGEEKPFQRCFCFYRSSIGRILKLFKTSPFPIWQFPSQATSCRGGQN